VQRICRSLVPTALLDTLALSHESASLLPGEVAAISRGLKIIETKYDEN